MIPEAAVEAAARAHQEMRAKLGYSQWDELNEMGREWRLEHMRAALEAAAPHMLADCWDASAKATTDYELEYRDALHFCDELPAPPVNPYRSRP